MPTTEGTRIRITSAHQCSTAIDPREMRDSKREESIWEHQEQPHMILKLIEERVGRARSLLYFSIGWGLLGDTPQVAKWTTRSVFPRVQPQMGSSTRNRHRSSGGRARCCRKRAFSDHLFG
ncbi:hypothetical protein BJV78DRAFT_580262 [Lactifluus subvellereus]|nr:hypothetical protein BJV78DRAFT_580262 [Lactifluus subvellereus]